MRKSVFFLLIVIFLVMAGCVSTGSYYRPNGTIFIQDHPSDPNIKIVRVKTDCGTKDYFVSRGGCIRDKISICGLMSCGVRICYDKPRGSDIVVETDTRKRF